MNDHKQLFPIRTMSRVFGVSRSGYYCWLTRSPSKCCLFNNKLRRAIQRVWKASAERYGSLQIHRQLVAEWDVSRQRIARLMSKMGIASRIRRKWVKTTESNHRWPVAPNLLDRNFSPKGLSEVWVSDITHIPS